MIFIMIKKQNFRTVEDLCIYEPELGLPVGRGTLINRLKIGRSDSEGKNQCWEDTDPF